ncbi:MAG: hypothetical protein ABIH03_14950 [Pseudomonadota bacterium]
MLAVEHPSGVRRVAYALFGNQAGQRVKKLGELLTRARKTGAIPWEWISDETRPERAPFVVIDSGDMRDLHRVCPSYDPWQDQPNRVVVWSEKSIGGTLAPVLDRFLVPFLVHHGNTSTTIMHATAKRTRQDARTLVILYVGDHDPKGLRISEDDIPKRLATYGAVNVRVRRLALLRADAIRLTALQDSFKPNDLDVAWYRRQTGLSYGVELEAISSIELRDRVEEAVQEEITDVTAWKRVMHASDVVRENWEAYVDHWPAPAIRGLGSEYGSER